MPVLGRGRSHLVRMPLHGFCRVALYLVFVFQDLTIDFVDQEVNRCIKIFIHGFAVYVFTAQSHGDFSSVPQGLY